MLWLVSISKIAREFFLLFRKIVVLGRLHGDGKGNRRENAGQKRSQTNGIDDSNTCHQWFPFPYGPTILPAIFQKPAKCITKARFLPLHAQRRRRPEYYFIIVNVVPEWIIGIRCCIVRLATE